MFLKIIQFNISIVKLRLKSGSHSGSLWLLKGVPLEQSAKINVE